MLRGRCLRIVSGGGFLPRGRGSIPTSDGCLIGSKDDLCHLTHGADFRVDHEVRGLVGMLSLFQ